MTDLATIRQMSRTDLEVFRATTNVTARPQLPFVVFAALRSTNDTFLPISNRIFPALLKAMNVIKSTGEPFNVTNVSSWLDHPEIKGCCFFNFHSHTCVYFITETQLAIMEHLQVPTIEEFTCKFNDISDKMPEFEPPTEEELQDEVIKHFYMQVNSEAANVDERTSRFNGATWFEEIQKKTILLAGLGGIGSYVCFLLARVQPATLFLYDDDVVESANMSGQLYGLGDVGERKANAIANMVRNYANYNNTFAIVEKYKDDSDTSDIMICGFDNMEARKLFYRKWSEHVTKKPKEERKNCLFIDGRLSAEYLQVYCITGDDIDSMTKYQNSALFNDSEADETVCSYKQTTYMANMIGSIIVNLFTNFVANEVAGAPIRELPYLTTYDGNSMELKIV